VNRIVNLDDSRNSVTFIISGKEFVISRIVMAVRDQWAIFLGKTQRVQSEVMNIVSGDITKAESLVQDFSEWKAEFIDKLLGKILVTNGYEYDSEWWADNADYSDIIKIINDSVTKDDEGKKKVAE
jgi:hypothetical protein